MPHFLDIEICLNGSGIFQKDSQTGQCIIKESFPYENGEFHGYNLCQTQRNEYARKII